MNYLSKFNGSFTIRNRETGEHRTFRVKTQPDNADFAPGERLVGLLCGSNNESDYTNFAFLKSNGIHVWRKFRGKRKKSPHEWYAEMLWELSKTESKWHTRYQLSVEKRCIRCNRKLTHPESIKTGIGPECSKRKEKSTRATKTTQKTNQKDSRRCKTGMLLNGQKDRNCSTEYVRRS